MLKKNEDSERAQIEQQQEIKNNLYPQSNQYKEMPQSSMRNEQEEITAQMRQLSVQDDARSEYKKKNNSSFNAILNQDSQSQQNFPQNQNFDNDTKPTTLNSNSKNSIETIYQNFWRTVI